MQILKSFRCAVLLILPFAIACDRNPAGVDQTPAMTLSAPRVDAVPCATCTPPNTVWIATADVTISNPTALENSVQSIELRVMAESGRVLVSNTRPNQSFQYPVVSIAPQGSLTLQAAVTVTSATDIADARYLVAVVTLRDGAVLREQRAVRLAG